MVTFCCGLPESAACTVKLVVPAVVGAPVIAPVEAFSDSPAGSVPAVKDQLTGATPPADCKVALYAVLEMPFGSEEVEIVRTGITMMLRTFVLVSAGVLESAA